jgi:hypothetical protein
VRDRDAKAGGKALLNWAFTTVSHHRLLSALTSHPPGTDRGRQSANLRITGGLVSYDQGKRSIATGSRSGEAARVPSVVPSARGLDTATTSASRVSSTWRTRVEHLEARASIRSWSAGRPPARFVSCRPGCRRRVSHPCRPSAGPGLQRLAGGRPAPAAVLGRQTTTAGASHRPTRARVQPSLTAQPSPNTPSHDGSGGLARHVANAILWTDSRGARLAKEQRPSVALTRPWPPSWRPIVPPSWPTRHPLSTPSGWDRLPGCSRQEWRVPVPDRYPATRAGRPPVGHDGAAAKP